MKKNRGDSRAIFARSSFALPKQNAEKTTNDPAIQILSV